MKLIPESASQQTRLICFAAFALVVLNAAKVAPQLWDIFLAGDGDDQMRLVQVRDWLAGQGWFDVRQYRVLPPDGISMHWSRYLDAGIGAVLTVTSLFLSPASAELATLLIWPSFLACLMVLILAHGNSRLFGPVAAIGALVVFFGWGKLGGEFVVGRIDHHGLQIMGATALFYLSLVQGRSRVLGALGGVVMAATLAIGLEMLPYFATVWGLMALRHAFDEDGTGDWLIGFAVAFSLSAPLLMVGQTPVSAWGAGYCDVLAVPIMTLGAVGVVTTLVPVLGARVLKGPTARIAALIVVSALGLWLAFPVLGHCLSGPYSDVSPEIRKTIETTITEALSIPVMLQSFPAILGRVILPPLIILIMAVVAVRHMFAQLTARQKIALLQAFVVSAIGLGIASYQVRAANLMTPAIPFLGGFVLHAFSLIPRSSRLRVPVLVVLLLGMPATVIKVVTYFLEPPPAGSPATGSTEQTNPRLSCRNAEGMAEIASLPKSLLFNYLNLGPTILLTSSHSVTSAAYHRSPDAFWNGTGGFGSVTAMHDALVKSGADYVVFCVGGLGDAEAMLLRSLKADRLPIWLKPEPEERKLVAVYRVDKTALAAANVSP